MLSAPGTERAVHRCWLGEVSPLTVDSRVTLSPEESAHVARVLRMRAGEHVQLIAAEKLYEGVLETVDERETSVQVAAALPSPEAATHLTLVQGLPKHDKLEWIIQKATELGVWNILPVEMERSVARLDGKEEKKRERWTRIAAEAAKQSGRAHVPEIQTACTLPQAAERLAAGAFDAIYLAWEEEGERLLSAALGELLARKPVPASIALIIGPEGGIAPAEAERLTALGAVSVSLGRRILRTETAGLCALAVTMGALGEM